MFAILPASYLCTKILKHCLYLFHSITVETAFICP